MKAVHDFCKELDLDVWQHSDYVSVRQPKTYAK